MISIRLEMINDGIEDYEYPGLLQKRTDAVADGGGNPQLLSQARALLEVLVDRQRKAAGTFERLAIEMERQ